MESGVFLLQGDDTLVRMVERPYDAESVFQVLLATHPDLLAGDQIDPVNPRRWLLIEREAGVPAESGGADWWAVDHLFLDQDATPTFVEVKRAADTRARREVVAQMLDYAANATAYWPIDRMREAFVRGCTSRGVEPGDELAAFLGPDSDEEAFWEMAKANLREGRIRLLFVADRVPPPLRRIVEFLNRQMNPAEVLAMEVRQFAGESGAPRTLVPRVIGQTEQARQAKASPGPRPRSTPIPLEEFVRGLPLDRVEVARSILRAAEASGFVPAAQRTPTGSGSVRLALRGVAGAPATLDDERLWVSLGRHHTALREPAANQEARQAILRISPSLRQAEDLRKTEVGIPLEAIGPESRDHLHGLFAVLGRALTRSETGADEGQTPSVG